MSFKQTSYKQHIYTNNFKQVTIYKRNKNPIAYYYESWSPCLWVIASLFYHFVSINYDTLNKLTLLLLLLLDILKGSNNIIPVLIMELVMQILEVSVYADTCQYFHEKESAYPETMPIYASGDIMDQLRR